MLLDTDLNSREHSIKEEETIPTRFKSYEPFREQMIKDVDDFILFKRQVDKGTPDILSPVDRERFVKTMQNITQIYFIYCPETCLVKIGRSNNIEKRIRTIQSISPSKISLLSCVTAHKSFEFYLHQKLKESRSHGEWFNADDRVLSVIDISLDKGVKGVYEYLENS